MMVIALSMKVLLGQYNDVGVGYLDITLDKFSFGVKIIDYIESCARTTY